jgi:hypothetical protein
VHQALEKHIRYVVNTKPLTYGSVPLTGWMPIRLFWKHLIRYRWWRDGTAGMAEAMLFTMKDWLVVLNEWEWRNHPEIPIGPGARAAFTAAELVEDTGARSREVAGSLKRRVRRLLARTWR